MNTKTNLNSGLILLNGEPPSQKALKPLLENSDYIVCADGAVQYLKSLAIQPHCILGDFDSASAEMLREYQGIKQIRYEDQNTSDGEKAIDYLVSLGIKEISLIGADGKRLDHSLYNLRLLSHYAKKGYDMILWTAEEKVTYHRAKKVEWLHKIGTRVSFFWQEANTCVSCEGFIYNLEVSRLDQEKDSLSNRITHEYAAIEIHNGGILVCETF